LEFGDPFRGLRELIATKQSGGFIQLRRNGRQLSPLLGDDCGEYRGDRDANERDNAEESCISRQVPRNHVRPFVDCTGPVGGSHFDYKATRGLTIGLFNNVDRRAAAKNG
jgi:hypothetical protein